MNARTHRHTHTHFYSRLHTRMHAQPHKHSQKHTHTYTLTHNCTPVGTTRACKHQIAGGVVIPHSLHVLMNALQQKNTVSVYRLHPTVCTCS